MATWVSSVNGFGPQKIACTPSPSAYSSAVTSASGMTRVVNEFAGAAYDINLFCTAGEVIFKQFSLSVVRYTTGTPMLVKLVRSSMKFCAVVFWLHNNTTSSVPAGFNAAMVLD